MFTQRRVLAAFALVLGLSFLGYGLPTHVGVRDARIVAAYEDDSSKGSIRWLRFDFSGPGASSIDNRVEDPGAAYTVAKQSRLPLPVRVRVRAESIQAIQIGGRWYGSGDFSRTTELTVGAVSVAISLAIVCAPWFGARRRGRAGSGVMTRTPPSA